VGQTTFPYRPNKGSDAGSIAWTVWQMLQYFANSIFDVFVNKFIQGTAVVAAGTTNVVVNVGLSSGAYQVELCPLADPGSRWWASAKTGANFQINLSAAAPAGGVPFDYFCKLP
jgi:hypothetical protein